MRILLVVLALACVSCVDPVGEDKQRKLPEFIYFEDAAGDCWALGVVEKVDRNLAMTGIKAVQNEVCETMHIDGLWQGTAKELNGRTPDGSDPVR